MENFRVLALEGLAHEVAEALGEWTVVDEKVFSAGADDAFFRRMPCEGGDDAVDMRVVLELPAPSVENAGEAALPAAGFGGDHIAQGCCAGF